MSDRMMATFDRMFAVAETIGQSMRASLARHGLTVAQSEVLFVLHTTGPLVQRELSQRLHCSPRYVTGLIDALTEQGRVRRGPHPTDRRAILVSLTDRGARESAALHERRRQAAHRWLGDLTPADLDTFAAVLDRILNDLNTPEPEPDDAPAPAPEPEPEPEPDSLTRR